MTIKFYNSRKRRGKAPAQEAVYKDFVETYQHTPAGKKKNLLFLVPRQTTLEVENALIEKTGGVGLFGSRVLSYDMIEREVLKDHGYDPTRILDAHGQVMMIQKASEDVGEELTLYRSSMGRAGFSKEAAKEIVLFRENGLEPESILEASDQAGDRMLGRKLKDLSTIYAQYLKILGDETIDLQKKIKLATELIREDGVFLGKDLYILGFTSLSVLEREMLLAIMEEAQNVRMAFITDRNPMADDASAFDGINRLEDTLIRELTKSGREVEVIDLPLQTRKDPLDHAEKTLLSYKPPVRVEANGKVSAHTFSDPWEEARYVAEVIRSRIREGLRAEQIAVILPDMDTYGPIFSKVFSEEGLDFFLDRREPIIQSAFIESLLGAIDAVRTGFDRDEILTFAKSYFSGLTPDEADTLENFVIQAGVQRGDWKRPFTDEKIVRRIGEERRGEAEEAERMRVQLMEALAPLQAKREPFEKKIEALRAFLEKIDAREALDGLTRRLESEGKLNEVIRYRQIWDMLVEVINQLEAALGEQEGDLSEFSTVLKNGLSTYSVGVIPETASLVMITDAHRGILPDGVSFLAFSGLNEGVFPSVPGAGGLLSDYEIKFLSENLGFKALDRERDDEYRFYSLLTSAGSELLFTNARFSSSGENLRDSVYMNRVRESFVLPDPETISSLQKLEKEDVQGVLLSYLQKRRKGLAADPVFEAALAYIKENGIKEGVEEEFRTIEKGLSFDGVDTKLDENTARALYNAKNFYVSASSLEDYASCPYRYALGRGIRLKEREEYEPRALDAGNLMHAFFENFFKQIEKEENPEALLEKISDPENPYLEEKAKEILSSQALEDYKPRYHTTHSAAYIYEKLEKMLRASARIQAEQLRRSGYQPALFETKIEETLEEGKDGKDKIKLTGKIDRVDLKGDSLTVVDYKSGAKKVVAYEAVNQGIMLQLLLYLENALTIMEGEKDPAGALYAFLQLGELAEGAQSSKIKDEKLQGFVSESLASQDSDLVSLGRGKENMLSKEEFSMILSFVRDKAKELAKEILSGNCKVAPAVTEKVNPCQHCPYRNICAVDLTPEKVHKLEKISKEKFFESAGEKQQKKESGKEDGH